MNRSFACGGGRGGCGGKGIDLSKLRVRAAMLEADLEKARIDSELQRSQAYECGYNAAIKEVADAQEKSAGGDAKEIRARVGDKAFVFDISTNALPADADFIRLYRDFIRSAKEFKEVDDLFDEGKVSEARRDQAGANFHSKKVELAKFIIGLELDKD